MPSDQASAQPAISSVDFEKKSAPIISNNVN